MVKFLRIVLIVLDCLIIGGCEVYAFLLIANSQGFLWLVFMLLSPVAVMAASAALYAFCDLCDNVENIKDNIYMISGNNKSNNQQYSILGFDKSKAKPVTTVKSIAEPVTTVKSISKKDEIEKLKEKYLKCQISEQEYNERLKALED